MTTCVDSLKHEYIRPRFFTSTILGLMFIFAAACQSAVPSESQAMPTVTPTETLAPTDTTTPMPSPTNTQTAVPTIANTIAASPTVPAEEQTYTPTRTPSPSPTLSPIPTSTPSNAGPEIMIGGVVFSAEIADTPALRTQGLSERDSIDSQTGMLFVFERGGVTAFWMNKMRFPLDFVWIGSDCTVADISKNVPNPEPNAPSSSLPTYRPSVPAEYNFEINAGESEQLGIEVGDPVIFLNISSPNAEC